MCEWYDFKLIWCFRRVHGADIVDHSPLFRRFVPFPVSDPTESISASASSAAASATSSIAAAASSAASSVRASASSVSSIINRASFETMHLVVTWRVPFLLTPSYGFCRPSAPVHLLSVHPTLPPPLLLATLEPLSRCLRSPTWLLAQPPLVSSLALSSCSLRHYHYTTNAPSSIYVSRTIHGLA